MFARDRRHPSACGFFLSRLDDASRGRALRVLAVAKPFTFAQDPRGAELRRRLSGTSGLSEKGISYVIENQLETSATPPEIDALLAQTGRAPRCHVVLSANVCTAALRAIALAVATSPIVFVRPSSRDPVLAEMLVDALQKDREFVETHGGSIELCPLVSPAPFDELHLYGSDEAIEAITRDLPDGVIVRAHGTGFGVAVIAGEEDVDLAASQLREDIIAFDQRGCLSPRVVLVEGDGERAEAVAFRLDKELAEAERFFPRGPLDDATARDVALYGASMEAVGLFLSRPAYAIGVDPSPRALLLPPAVRVVHLAAARAEDASRLLAPWLEYVTTVGRTSRNQSALIRAVLSLVPKARRAELGFMQRPPLDGPVDLRTSRVVTPLVGALARRRLSS